MNRDDSPEADDADGELGEIKLQPLDPETERSRQKIREPRHELSPRDFRDEYPAASPVVVQYGLREMLLGMSVLAVGLATLQFFAPTAIAFTIGVLAMVTFLWVSVIQPDIPALHRAAWCLLITYILVSIVALYRA